MVTKFIALCDGRVGEGETLEEAWNELKDRADDAQDIEYCSFYSVERVMVEVKLVTVEKVTPVRKCK